MMQRRAFLGAGAAAGLLLSGCDLSLRDGVLNKCIAELPPDLRDALRFVYVTRFTEALPHILA